MKILVLTSVYPEPDDGIEIVTPTVKYFCDKWVEQGHKVVVIHNNSCFTLPFYWIPDFFRKKMESKFRKNTLDYRRNVCRSDWMHPYLSRFRT